MIKGYLRVMVLKELINKAQSGYSLIQRLHQDIGRRPSPGSMYPLLNDLLAQGLIQAREEGRRKIYSITQKGKEMIDSLMREKEAMMVMHSELVRLCTGRECKAHFSDLQEMVKTLESRGSILVRNIDVWAELRAAVFKLLVSEGIEDKEKRAREILEETTRKIEELAKRG